MVASVSSPADLVNVALRKIGYRLRVGSLFDGSDAGNQALDVYAQTRDELLRMNDWGFAERNLSLTALKYAPASGYVPPVVWTNAYPPLPWAFEYAYPDDCLKVRALKQSPLFLFDPDPQPILFSIANDTVSSVSQRVILANIQDAIAVYTGQVTDPASWDVDFTEAFASALATRLIPSLGNAQMLQIAEREEVAATLVAEQNQG